jgi:hypothetical protein
MLEADPDLQREEEIDTLPLYFVQALLEGLNKI